MRTYPANLVADFFLALSKPDVGDVLTNLKLQKLCYYAAGISATVRQDDSSPIFKDRIEAWLHGPVVPSLYARFRNCGADPIPPVENFDFSLIDERDVDLLEDIYKFYGQYSAWKLRDMTHEEAPWIEAYAKEDKQIRVADLREFFASEVDEDYAESYREKQGQQEAVQG